MGLAAPWKTLLLSGLLSRQAWLREGKDGFTRNRGIPVSRSELILSCSVAKGKLQVRPSFEGGP